MERYDLTQDETGVSNLSKACTKSHFSAATEIPRFRESQPASRDLYYLTVTKL